MVGRRCISGRAVMADTEAMSVPAPTVPAKTAYRRLAHQGERVIGVKQLPSVPDLQEALSGVPPRVWAARMDRQVRRARRIGQLSIDLPEMTAAGVLVWRAELDEAGSGTALLAAWSAAKPTRSRWVLRLRRWTGAAVFAQPAQVGTMGEHHWGEIVAVVLCGIAGLFSGAWAVGGPVSVWMGAMVGAAAGWVMWWTFLMMGRRRLLSRPVDITDPELMSLVVQLAETGRRAAALQLPDTDLDAGWTAHQISYQVVDPQLTDEEFIRLRYQAQMLGHAVGKRCAPRRTSTRRPPCRYPTPGHRR